MESPKGHGGQPKSVDQLSRLREYMVDSCEDLLQVKGNFQFKAYEWPEILDLLDDEERAHRSWKEEQAQLHILMNSKPERPVWLYQAPRAQPFYRSIRKELIIAMERTFMSVDVEQILWAIRQYVKRSSQTPLPGGPLELQKKGHYDRLLDMCRGDIRDLPYILPEDHKVNLDRYVESIGQYMNKFFEIVDEIDEKPVWANGLLAQKHLKALGFPEGKNDKCRNSPENRPSGTQ